MKDFHGKKQKKLGKSFTTGFSMDKDDLFEYLIVAGIVEFAGMDTETNEMLYRFTDNLEQIDPEMFMRFTQMIQHDIYSLWEKGFLNMDVTQENPLVTLTKKALTKEIVQKELSRDEQRSLEVIMLYMSK